MKMTGMRMCCAAVIVCLVLGTASAATFINGGFEDGTTTNGWTCGGGLWSDHPGWPQNFNDYTNPAQFMGAIVTTGYDLIVGTNLNRVFNGNYALRVNDSTNGCHVSTAVQTVSNWTGTNIYFAWAAVLQASHSSNDSDNFALQLRDETLGSNLITRTYSSYNAGPIFTITNQGPSHDWSATPWQIEQLDVSAYIGDTFTISVLASDCLLGGHAGYVYVDCFGSSIPTTNTTSDGWLAIQVTPVGGTWQLTAPAGYTGPTVGTGNLAAVSAVTGGYGIAYGALTGYVAPSNQTGFVTGGSTSIFTGVYLQISTNIGTPAGVSATEGTYTNKIRISWQGVAGATGYEIWRSQTNDSSTAARIADIPLITLWSLTSSSDDDASQPSALRLQSSTYYYDDYNINPIYAYYYWVRAKNSSLISPMSYVGMGYAVLSPDQKTGTVDIGAGDLVYLPVNMTNLSHAGTISCRVTNNGPDALVSSSVGFDFYMWTNTANMVWIGSAQSNLTLNSGSEALVILGPTAKRGLIVRGDLSGVQQAKVTVRHLSTLYDPNPANNTTLAAGSIRIKTNGVNSIGRSFNDYDGDGKADGALCATNMSAWAVLLSGTRYRDGVVVEPGQTDWIAVPGDYEGAGRTGVGIYVPDYGLWYAWFSSDGGHGESGFLGGPDYTPIPCDFDGDAKTDPVVYREEDGYWYGAASSEGYELKYAPGPWSGYSPVAGDYDGDGLADPAAYYNHETGTWVLGPSSMGYYLLTGEFGGWGWTAASADYDGDGKTDPAVYAPAMAYWQILLSGSLETTGQYTWWGGVAGDINGIPVPADYDGDGKADLAVYHQDTGIWELFLSTHGYQIVWGGFGGPEYVPATE